MDILVRGRNVPVDRAIEAESQRKLGKLPRFAPDIRRIEVEFSEIRNPRASERIQCEVIVHLTGTFVKAHATATDLRSALDRVIDKLENQAGRVKSKRIARSRPHHGAVLQHVK